MFYEYELSNFVWRVTSLYTDLNCAVPTSRHNDGVSMVGRESHT